MQKRILIFDDNEDILFVIQEVLRGENYLTMAVSDMGAFDHALWAWKPDLVMLDYKLPDADGLEICGRLKESEATRHLPVILLTAYFDATKDVSGWPCDLLIPKPFDIGDVIARVAALLN